jgi:hypothetical protein
MATVTGARGTTLIGSEQRTVNMEGRIKLLQPNETPFTTFLQQLRKERTADPKFKSDEDQLEPRFDAINNGAGYNSSATSVVVDNGAYFAQHDLVLNTRTGEMVRVTAVSTNTLTVVRGVGSTAAAMLDNDELLLAGSAQPEGDTSKPARSSNPSPLTGYTQIFRRPWELTGTAIASENETTPHDWDLQADKVGIEHKRDMERAFLFNGTPSEDTSGSQARRTTGGIISAITTNATDAGGTFTETEFNTAMRQAFRYGTKRKVLMASPLLVSVLNTYASGKIQVTDQGRSSYGVDVTTFTSPFGAVRLVVNWELEGAKYGGYGVIIDFDNVAYKYLANNKANRDSKVRTNIQAPDADTRKDEWLTECGLQINLQQTHALITGVTG